MTRPKTRLRLLEAIFAAEIDRAKLCCAFDRDRLEVYVDALLERLDAPELPTAPPLLPTCRKAADASTCPEGRECAARVWGNLRRVAVLTAGLVETAL
jgi:hypothetical protein